MSKLEGSSYKTISPKELMSLLPKLSSDRCCEQLPETLQTKVS